MEELKEENKTIFLAIIVTALFMSGVFFIVYVFTDYITINVNKQISIEDFEIGDRFETTMECNDPFQKPFTYRGTIIAIQGDYVQFIRENGDTSSTDFAYECQKFKVKKLPK